MNDDLAYTCVDTKASPAQDLPQCPIFHMDWWKAPACGGSLPNSWEVETISSASVRLLCSVGFMGTIIY